MGKVGKKGQKLETEIWKLRCWGENSNFWKRRDIDRDEAGPRYNWHSQPVQFSSQAVFKLPQGCKACLLPLPLLTKWVWTTSLCERGIACRLQSRARTIYINVLKKADGHSDWKQDTKRGFHWCLRMTNESLLERLCLIIPHDTIFINHYTFSQKSQRF